MAANAQDGDASSYTTAEPPLDDVQPGDIPTDAQLESRGATIGRIRIVVDDIFEPADSLRAPYRLANSLHVSTRETTVLQHLLFRTGDRFDRRLLEESARILREARYLADASVEPVHYGSDNSVDVLVRVQDVWTMSPGFSFGRSGGANNVRLEFEDTNFLGLGKTFAVERTANVDRTAWRLAYVDPHLFDTWWKLAASHSTLSDGSDDRFSLGRPFYSLDCRWSVGVDLMDIEQALPRYSLGEETGRFAAAEQSFAVNGGVSRGLADGWSTRYLFGARYDAADFEALPDEPAMSIPEDRRYAYPYVGVQWIEDAYVTTRNLQQIGRTEDLHLGRSLALTAGFASTALGSTKDAWILTASAEAGSSLGNERFLIGRFSFGTRVEDLELRNALLEFSGGFHARQSPRRVLYIGVNAATSSDLDEDKQMLLGGDNGLRGYPLRYQAGTSRAVLTAEERFYTSWQPFKLVNVGAAIFADVGRTWGRDPFAAAPMGWLSDVGFGLRLGSPRSGLGNVLHVDLAFPLDGGDDIENVQLLIETRKSF